MLTNIFLSIFEVSVSASLVVAVLVLAAPLLNRRYGVKWKYFIWLFMALWLIIPLGRNGVRAIAGRVVRLAVRENGGQMRETGNGAKPLAGLPGIVVEIPDQMTLPVTLPEEGTAGMTPLDILALFWLGVCLCILGFYLIGYVCFRRKLKRTGILVQDRVVLDRCRLLLEELNIRRALPVVKCTGAPSPMIIGFIKPVLVLPKEQYGGDALYFILKHELMHLKYHDVCFKLLLIAAGTMHWFNPVIWLMQKEAAADMELSCDERVIRGAGYAERKAYTETLMSALHKNSMGKAVLSTQFSGGKEIMKKRFQNILGKAGKRNGFFLTVCGIALTVLLGILTGCSVAEPDRTASTGGSRVSDGGEDRRFEKDCRPGDETFSSDLEQEEVEESNGAGEEVQPMSVAGESTAGSGLWELDGSWGEKDSYTLNFTTGLQLILPEGWQDRIELTVESENDGPVLSVGTKDKTESGIGRTMFRLWYVDSEGYDRENRFTILGRETDRVIGVYVRDGKEYALIFEVPQIYHLAGDSETVRELNEISQDYRDVFESIAEVQVLTRNMPGFTECGLEELDWLGVWGRSE